MPEVSPPLRAPAARMAVPLVGRCTERWSNEVLMFGRACRHRLTAIVACVRRVVRACLWARPVVCTHAAGVGTDLARSRAQLLAENALLRQQLLVLRRSVKRRP